MCFLRSTGGAGVSICTLGFSTSSCPLKSLAATAVVSRRPERSETVTYYIGRAKEPLGLPGTLVKRSASSHPVVIGAAPAFGRNPGDDLIGILDIAGFA